MFLRYPVTPDLNLLTWATGEGRIVLTQDVTTMVPAMHEQLRLAGSCAPIVLVPESMPIGQAVEEILLIDRCGSDDDFCGRSAGICRCDEARSLSFSRSPPPSRYNLKLCTCPLDPRPRLLYRGIDLYGRKTGVVCGANRFTYAQFGERCERLAAGLIAEGIKPGARVAYLSFNTHQLLEGYYGVTVLARAIVMPLNGRLHRRRTSPGILCHAEPDILIYESDFSATVDQLRAACPSIRRFIEIGAPYEELLSHGRLDRQDIFSYDESAIAELFYTSGSTGTPKGVTLTHRTLYLHAISVAASMAREDNSVELHTIPLFHANGWGRAHSSVMYGLRQVMVRRFDPAQILKLIQDERACSMCLVPTMANALLNCPDLASFDVSSLVEINLGGAASSPELVAKLEAAFAGRVQAGWRRSSPRPAPSPRPRAPRAPSSTPTKMTGCATSPTPVGRFPAARFASSIRKDRTSRATCSPSAKSSSAAISSWTVITKIPKRRAPYSTTVGCTPATWPCGTTRITSTSSTARRTSSSAAAKTSPPSKSSAPSPRIPPFSNAALSLHPTLNGARCLPPSSC